MKFKKIITVLMTMIILLSNLMVTNVSMAYTGEKVKVQTNAEFNDYLTYGGTPARFIYVFYLNEKGEEYPAYCVQGDVPGVEATEEKSYEVTASGILRDEQIWRIIHKSYPYVSISDMGCSDKYECYVATKAAIDCILNNKDVNKYAAATTERNDVIKALKKLVNYANDTSIVPYTNEITIETVEDWKLENVNNKIYLSKIFEATNPYMQENYTVSLNRVVPAGTLVVNSNNEQTNEFAPGEIFKILIPRESVTSSQTMGIAVRTNISTLPIYRGLPNGNYQIYALTGMDTEEGYEIINETYKTMGGTMIINKLDGKTREPLAGAIFRISDTNGNMITETRATSIDGELMIYNLPEGKYFVEEIQAPKTYNKINGKMLIPVYDKAKSFFDVLNTKTQVIEEEVHNVVVQVVENTTQTTVKTENEHYYYETNTNIENNIETNNNTIEKETNNNIVNDTTNNNTTITNNNTNIENNTTTNNETKENNTTNITNNNETKENIEINETINSIQNNDTTTTEKTTKVENNQIQNNINTGKKLPKTGM